MLLFTIMSLNAQVGIGTTTPDDSAALDITSTDSGFLMPRVALTATTDTATITGTEEESLLVYNTATINDVTPGFYYWNGTVWVALNATIPAAWELLGNAGTVAGTNFLGTTDGVDLVFKTNNVERLRIDNGDQIYATSTGGTEALPFYSFNGDIDTGIWTDGANNLSLGANAQEFLTLDGNAAEAIINNDGDDIDFRVRTSGNANGLFVDGGNDRVGILTNTPATTLNIAGVGSVVRIDNLNATNDANNNGTDLSPLAVNANGDIVIGGPTFLNNIPVDASSADTFLPAPISVSSADETLGIVTLHTENITLTQTTLVEVVFWTGTQVVTNSGGLITDGEPRLYGGLVTHTGTGEDIVYSSGTYTNSRTFGTITNAYFTIGGNGYMLLGPGNHTFELVGFAQGGNSGGYRVTFGGNGISRFQIIYHN